MADMDAQDKSWKTPNEVHFCFVIIVCNVCCIANLIFTHNISDYTATAFETETESTSSQIG